MNIAFKYSDKDVLIMTAGLLGETASEVGACPVPAWDGSEGKGREGSVEISTGEVGLSIPEGEREGSATVVAGKADWGSGERVERSPLRTVSR